MSAPAPVNACRHQGGERDCPTRCADIYGERYLTHTPKETLVNPWQNRHPSVKHFGPLFGYAHLPPHLQAVSRPFGELAGLLLGLLDDGPELSTALRKLVEAKDCAVRQLVQDRAES